MKGQVFEGDFYPVPVHWCWLPGGKILMAAPNVVEYGHVGLEFFYALVKAHEHGRPLFFIRPKRVVGESFFELRCDEVHIVERTVVRHLFFNIVWRAAEVVEAWRVWKRIFSSVLFKEKRRALRLVIASNPDAPYAEALKEVRRGLTAPVANDESSEFRPYYRRRNLLRPFKLQFRPGPLAEVRHAAAQVGITPETKIVMLHVREPGWKRGREVQLLKPGRGRDDSVRNAHIESHLPAIDYLVEQGYTVVRMGDPTMRPLQRPGVIDLATLSPPNPRLQLYCLMNAAFIMCGESGPLGFSAVTGTPSLAVNCTDPVSAFPIRGDSLYMMKTIIDRQTGQRLSMPETLTVRYLNHLRDATRFQYIENTPDELLQAVKEMLTLLREAPPATSAQHEYGVLATRAASELRPQLNYVRKWGTDSGFLGEGRLVSFVAERDMPSPPTGENAFTADPATDTSPRAAAALDSR